MKKFLLILSLCPALTGISQNHDPNGEVTFDQAYDAGHVLRAKKILLSRLSAGDTASRNSLNLACLYSLLQNPDSAFYYLQKYHRQDPSHVRLLTDPDLYHLSCDKRWSEVERLFGEQYFQDHPAQNRELVLRLFRMKLRDQAFYYHIEILESMLGNRNEAVQYYWKLKDSINKGNLRELKEIIEKSGWPKFSEVGETGSRCAFLIVQHSDLESMKHYLPILEQAAKQNEASWSDVALMTDRILINTGKKQLYGSQVDPRTNTPYPIEDEKNVDLRRKEKNLVSLSEYLFRMGIEYKKPE